MQEVSLIDRPARSRQLLSWAVFIQGLVSLALVTVVGLMVYRGMPIYYIPPGGAGVAQPGTISDGYAIDFAARWLTARYSFTPDTIQASHREILPSLHPTVQNAFKKGAEAEAQEIKTQQLGAHFTFLRGVVQARRDKEVLVHVVGLRSKYKRKVHLTDEEVTGIIGVVPWVGQGHDRGVMVSRIDLKPAFGEIGE